MTKVSGYIVLRKPEMNYVKEGRGAFLPYAPRIGDLYYAGVDRMEWFEIAEGYYAGTLSNDVMTLWNKLKKSSPYPTDFRFMLDIKKAIQILEYSNKDRSMNELVAIRSERIENINGSITCEHDITWLGIDVYCHGYGSLIREGLFVKPNLFSSYLDHLNKNVLFDLDSQVIDEYIKSYIECAKNNNLEYIDGAESELEEITIGRINIRRK